MKRFTIAISENAATASCAANDFGETAYLWTRFRHCTQVGDSIADVTGCAPVYKFRDDAGMVHTHIGGYAHITEEPGGVVMGSITVPTQKEATDEKGSGKF